MVTDERRVRRALGLMSGTSYDAVDVALIETDGVDVYDFGPAGECAFTREERSLIQSATGAALDWAFEGDQPEIFTPAEAAITAAHARAVAAFVVDHGLALSDIDVIGFHGQTVLHRPPANVPGATRQLGNGPALAQLLSVDVVYDYRSADVAAGGHGAPLAPIYHWSLARRSGLSKVAVLNLGGVANITFVSEQPEHLIAFDTGPANGLLDQWVAHNNAGVCDEDGRFAAAGRVHEDVLARLMDHRHFALPPPKSLDRYAFLIDVVSGLTLEDGCATLTAFTARSLALAFAFAPFDVREMIVAGGGARNPTLISAIRDECPAPLRMSSDLGWRGDALEAELMAYLAVRSLAGLPLSFPQTTGVPRPLTGGVCATKK